jgi:RNA polymerase-binding transcription factor DksA
MTMNTHTSVDASTPTPDVAVTLARIEATRTAHLDSLGETADDVVAIAHRDAVRRILADVRAARRRLEAGLYDVCARCSRAIGGDERHEMLPWATHCRSCARQEGDR